MSLASKRGEFLLRAQDALEALFPGTMTVAGESFTVARSGEDRTEAAEVGGFEEEVAVTVRARLSDVPDDGWERETLATLDGRAMRVVECLREIGDVAWSVELETA
jgi:hypothetical protein